jgi:hypothetical protein
LESLSTEMGKTATTAWGNEFEFPFWPCRLWIIAGTPEMPTTGLPSAINAAIRDPAALPGWLASTPQRGAGVELDRLGTLPPLKGLVVCPPRLIAAIWLAVAAISR